MPEPRLTAEEILRDPEFFALPYADRVSVLGAVDPDFAALPDADKRSVFDFSQAQLAGSSREDSGSIQGSIPGMEKLGPLPGVPTVRPNVREIGEQEYRADKFKRDNPELADAAQAVDAYNAANPGLARFANRPPLLSEVGTGLLASAPMVAGSVAGTAEAGARAMGLDGVADALGDLRAVTEAARERQAARVPDVTGIASAGDTLDWLAYQSGQSAGQIAATLAAGVLGGKLGGPLGAAAASIAMAYAQNAGEIYGGMKEKGVDAPKTALAAGVPAALLDYLVPGRAVEDIAKGQAVRHLAGRMGKDAVVEGVTEGGQEGIGLMAEWLAGAPVEAREVLSRIVNAVAGGAVAGPVASGVARLATPDSPDVSAPGTVVTEGTVSPDAPPTPGVQEIPLAPEASQPIAPANDALTRAIPPELEPAAAIARQNGKISITQIETGLGIPRKQAQAIFKQLREAGVINGIGRAIEAADTPYAPAGEPAPVGPDPAIVYDKPGETVYTGDIPPEPGTLPAQPAAGPATLPRHLAGAKPRYSYGAKRFELEFESDIDRAAYITAQEKRSKRDQEYLDFVMAETGLFEDEVRQLGARIREGIKQQAKDGEPGKLAVARVFGTAAAPAPDLDLVNPQPEPQSVAEEPQAATDENGAEIGTPASVEAPAAPAKPKAEKPYNPDRDLRKMDRELHARAAADVKERIAHTSGHAPLSALEFMQLQMKAMNPERLSPSDRDTLYDILDVPESERGPRDREDMPTQPPPKPNKLQAASEELYQKYVAGGHFDRTPDVAARALNVSTAVAKKFERRHTAEKQLENLKAKLPSMSDADLAENVKATDGRASKEEAEAIRGEVQRRSAPAPKPKFNQDVQFTPATPAEIEAAVTPPPAPPKSLSSPESDAGIASPAETPILRTETTDDGGTATVPVPDASRDEHPEALGEAPPADVRGAESQGQADPGGVRGAGEDVGSVHRPDAPPQDASGAGEGDRQPGVVSDSGRGRSSQPRVRPRRDGGSDSGSLARDHRIADGDGIGEGSPRQKAAANIEAIRLLKKIEEEGRAATPEEKRILAKYTGWGGLAQAFTYSYEREWQGVKDELQAALTDEEYKSARASTPNAHYTSPLVIRAMWRMAERLGLKPGASILEPSMGVGHFFGLMPEGLHPDAKRVGIELDLITGRIAKLLYPDSNVQVAGFEAVRLPDNWFDLAISNVPFGNYAVHDPKYKRSPITRSIHDYFFGKALDKVRPGGVVAFITSSFTMDKKDSAIRKYLADRADLVAAFRLPNTAFKGNAGTEVTTDLIILKKRPPQTEAKGESWLNLATAKAQTRRPDGSRGETDVEVNEYYARHPENMLGQLAVDRGMYNAETKELQGQLTPELLDAAIARLPENVIEEWQSGTDLSEGAVSAMEFPEAGHVKDHAYAVDGKGVVMVREGDLFRPANVPKSVADRIKAILPVRDAVREVFRTQLSDATDAEIAAARGALNRVYDRFVKAHGPLNLPVNVKAFSEDPDAPLLLSLENYDPDSKTATKADVFSKRTIERYKPVEHVETASEALAVSLNEKGRLDWIRMEDLTGRSAAELQEELGELAYQNPDTRAWEPADEYLSGTVRDKLAAAEAAAKTDPRYQRNVDALKAVQPTDLKPSEIDVRLGAGWIPTDDVRDFIAELLGISQRDVEVAYLEPLAKWFVKLNDRVKLRATNTTTWGHPSYYAHELIDDALNLKTPTVYDSHPDGTRTVNQDATLAVREKQHKIKARFGGDPLTGELGWVWENPARAERLARLYNDSFNNLRLRQYDGSHLKLPGMARLTLNNQDLRPHQKNSVWRMLQRGNTLLAHVVGAGKTFAMISGAMEMRRLGLAKKPMIVVPNYLVEQWGADFLRLYPTANIFIAGKEHFQAGNRQKAMARIATGNWDAVIVGYESFGKLPVSDDTFNGYLQQQIDELDHYIREAHRDKSDNNKRLVKELEKAKKRLEAKIRTKANREAKDDTVTFEDMGVDQLFVDEAHNFKNLFFATKMTRIAGLPNSESQRAFDLFVKTRHVMGLNGGRGVVFATGTPISNTMAEMFTMQRYLQPDYLGAHGMSHFDSWAQNFGASVTAWELAPDGSGYRQNTRFAEFTNLPELLNGFRLMADVQTADMLKLPRPKLKGGKPQAVAAPATPMLKAYVETLIERAKEIRNVDPRVDNMLKITGDGRKAALDLRLVLPDAPDDPASKTNQGVEKIHRIWKDAAADKSTQLVFIDFSTPNEKKGAGGFNVYDDMRAKLVAKGIPDKEIAYIHHYSTDAEKQQLFDAVNAGRIRILFGSTAKMGAGMNVQKRLIALHHMDAPWRPSDIEQREGRILRQGNTNEEVQIYRYVTEGSFDAYMWQTLETKAKFINQVMSGDVTVRRAADMENPAMTYAEMKAVASGNPLVLERVKVDMELRKLDALRRAHRDEQFNVRSRIGALPGSIQWSETAVKATERDIATRDANPNQFTVGSRTFTGDDARKEAAAAIAQWLENSRGERTPALFGSYRGLKLYTRPGFAANVMTGNPPLPNVTIEGAATYGATANPDNPMGTIMSIEAVVRNFETTRDGFMQELERRRQSLATLEAEANKPFAHEARVEELLKRQAEITKALDLNQHDHQAAAPDDSDAKPDKNAEAGFVAADILSPALAAVDAATDAAKAIKDWLSPNLSRIRAQGASGAKLAALIERATDVGEVTAGGRVARLADQQLRKMTRGERLHLVDVLEGRAPASSAKIVTAAAGVRAILDEIAGEATQLGVAVKVKKTLAPGDPIPPGVTLTAKQQAARAAGKRVFVAFKRPFMQRGDYFPHVIRHVSQLKRGQIREDVLDNLVRLGLRGDRAGAQAFLDAYVKFIESGKREQMLINYVVASGQASSEKDALNMLMRHREHAMQRSGSLEYSREVNLPFWDPDALRVLPQQIARQSLRLKQIAGFGQDNQRIKALINKIRREGGNFALAKKAVDQIVGYANEPDDALARAGRILRAWQGFKLGLAGIANLTQGPLNTMWAADLRAVVEGYGGIATKSGRELRRRFATESGATLESTISESLRHAGAEGEALAKYLNAVGFTATERANRILAANAGKAYAERMYKRYRLGDKRAELVLRELGLDPPALTLRGGLSRGDVLLAAKKFSDLTQFRSRPQDLPMFANTDVGKVFFQFKTYIYGQTRLVHREFSKDLKSKSYGHATRNALLLATVFPVTGAAVAAVRNLLTGREDDEDESALWNWLEAGTRVGMAGFLGDLVESAQYPGGALSWMAGPTFGEIGKAIEVAARGGKGGGKFLTRSVPFIGPLLVNRVFPKPESADPFNDPEWRRIMRESYVQ
jgi:N12 class adenine-specific DNA methylase